MYKLGVVQINDFALYALSQEKQHLGWWPFSYLLLRDLKILRGESYEEEILERVYRSMLAGKGIYKITTANRFCELDIAINRFVQQQAFNEVVVHDMGISNGITSFELFNILSKSCKVKFYASDYYDSIYTVRDNQSGWTFIFDLDENPLQFVSKHFVISGYRAELLRYPVNYFVQAWVRFQLFPRARKVLSEAVKLKLESGCDFNNYNFDRIPLFHPRVIETAANTDRFILFRHNVFDRNPVKAHVIRLMNVLTPNHFIPDQVIRGLQQSIYNLNKKGILVIGRTVDENDGRTCATAYQIVANKLKPVWQINNGYEWPELVDRVVPFCDNQD